MPQATQGCSHPPQNQHLLFYIQACTNFSVTLHGYVVRNRNIQYTFNALFKSIYNWRFYSTLLCIKILCTNPEACSGRNDRRATTARSIHIDAIVKEENTTSANTITNHRIERERGFVREKASARTRERASI
jgi:hypothetical protein